MVIHNGNLAQINDQIRQGYNPTGGGNWNNTSGIVSSAAAADTTHLTAIGVILNGSSYGSGTTLGLFDNINAVSTDVLVKYTYYGDANLDGAVDGSDYSLIDIGFHNGLTGWGNGDFNYDGIVDGSDYTLIDNAYNTQGGTLGSNPASLIADETEQIAGYSTVPEPAGILIVPVTIVGLFARRRRRNSCC
jgi:hypothetical protein